MKWSDKGRSRNLEDRRGVRATGKGVGGKLQLGGIGVVIAIVATLLGRPDLLSFLESGSQSGASATSGGAPVSRTAEEERMDRFLSFLIDDMEKVWTSKLQGTPARYEAPILVVFRDGVDSACGFASAATGPFYCPGDHKLYLDTSFFRELAEKLGAAGDFAQAYVVAHEVGHHLQTLFGTSARMRKAQARQPSKKNQLSVLLELQADCYAGIWGHQANQRGILEVGDLEEALTAAMAIGDDTLQKQATGTVRPESFTHGSSAQRRKWFSIGYQEGSIEACNTFAGEDIDI